MRPLWALEDKNMQNENRNEEAVSPVIATILMVAITVVLAGVLYVWASQLAEGNTDGDFSMYDFSVTDAAGTPGTDASEALVYVAMDNGDDLSWASVIVQVAADGGVYTHAPTLTKQSTLAVLFLTTTTVAGASEKKLPSAKEQIQSVTALAPFKLRF